uniref:Uncharacterized protein n=1 Tax=Percolomonas cosmopolitus TaxID=63605 RepID=A0A7S1KSC9_9EUKA|mmetsp:Transcript_6701/g.25082  ORF Transcript_6701/g.25082 Transcript_6701/m.25082 type:complete len:163 (+) Transcript_6701:82-570(+)|eukprot:CAMPEP_0117449072 /NCGR_PEP_ID=MMETSP0759-20121206/7749_1 /TAXON_ID=63605 /ORGANISM="Percolomonas cosmopolitus, Strain WS" /LENGTH=162 /DNA_ID=CAMNT_0005241521 /DNA_START=60 /DNA_END=548 /DNA_ORIENTATION=-
MPIHRPTQSTHTASKKSTSSPSPIAATDSISDEENSNSNQNEKRWSTVALLLPGKDPPVYAQTLHKYLGPEYIRLLCASKELEEKNRKLDERHTLMREANEREKEKQRRLMAELNEIDARIKSKKQQMSKRSGRIAYFDTPSTDATHDGTSTLRHRHESKQK